MHPILLKLGPLTIHSYGFFMAMGVAFGILFLYRQARRQGLDASRMIDAAFYIMIVALIGSKLTLLVGNFSYYLSNPRELLWIARSGGVFQGGLVFGLLFALWYFRKYKLPTLKIADIVGPALALGHGFGRIGCFLAGCCYGRACTLPWAANFQSGYAHNLTGVPIHQDIHPVQLYEAALNFANALVLYLLLRKKKYDGQVFSFYMINYAVIRFFTEWFRGDHSSAGYLFEGPSAFLSLSFSQVFCLIALVAGLILLRVFKKRARG
ncbi:MAG: prolipoprotein diacylglyceryl transferase [Candidatus Aminicenantales bacterium]